MNKVKNRSKGYGYVTFAEEAEARKALTAMNGQVGVALCFSFLFHNLLISVFCMTIDETEILSAYGFNTFLMSRMYNFSMFRIVKLKFDKW